MSMRSDIGAGDDQAATQGGMALRPPPQSQMVLLSLEAKWDQRDEDIRMALSRFASSGDIQILRGGDSYLLLHLHAITNLNKGNYSGANMTSHNSSELPILCTCGLRSALYFKDPMKFPFSEIQAAMSDFSNEKLLGEGLLGHVYMGRLKDGQIIAANLRKRNSLQIYAAFCNEIEVLSFAQHRNIVRLLGYCCEESHRIMVYEYVCNNSLEWHLFDKSADLLDWHTRHAIALGIAKGLRYLHEECHAGPIIHGKL